MLSNLYRKTSYDAFSMCSLLRNLEWTRPKVLNIVLIPAVLALAGKSCTTREKIFLFNTDSWDSHWSRGSMLYFHFWYENICSKRSRFGLIISHRWRCWWRVTNIFNWDGVNVPSLSETHLYLIYRLIFFI